MPIEGRAVGAVAVAGEARATALGQVRHALALIVADPHARTLLAPAMPDGSGLTDWLYARWWCGPGLRTPARPVTDLSEPSRGAARLEAARRTVAARSGGWLVLAAVSGTLVAARLTSEPAYRSAPSNRRLRTSTDAVVASSRPGRPPRPGDLVTLRHGSAGLDPAGAWWWAHTGRPEDLAETPLDRWYVHARDLVAATGLVPVLLAAAAEAGCGVSLKCPPTPAGYGRRDALVVYLPRASAPAAEAALLRRADLVSALVDPDVPPLTRRLLPGVAQAEDPGPPDPAGTGSATGAGISYGQLRAGQIATVATRLLGSGAASATTEAITDAMLATELALAGIGVDAPQRVSA